MASSFLDLREVMDSSDSGKDVFLSHSGKQKNFVEHLYHALDRANQRVFFDKHSLRKASAFPPAIMRAVHDCKLGVIVVSEDYFTSRWPMLELEMLHRGGTQLLPLFYALRSRDLKSPTNLSQWRSTWKTITEDEQQKHQWATAVRYLRSINGITYEQSMSEVDYINRVVTEVCNIICPYPLYDQSWIRGRQALVEEIKGYFELVANANKGEKICMVGLHGVGGLGKTTLCQSMVNFYNSEYRGRSCLIEFPTDSDKWVVLKECTIALKDLANLSECVCAGIRDFDQVVKLMKDHVTKLDVFLAIDNVWSVHSEYARKLLGIGFTATSRILLTSRSEEVLQDLFNPHSENSCVRPLPVPQHEDAFQIFQHYVERGDLASLPVRHRIDRLLKRCRYDGKYHPLALRSAASYVKGLCAGFSSEMNEDDWCSILREMEDTALESVDATIALNYGGLEQTLKHMFLDIAVCMQFCIEERMTGPNVFERTRANAVLLLSILYKEFTKLRIEKSIRDLAVAGVMQMEKYSNGEQRVRLHDLYWELAMKEATSNPRFLISTKVAVEEMEWGKLERVILLKYDGCRVFEKLQFQQMCKNIKFLCASNIEHKTPISLESLTSLRILMLFGRRIDALWSDLDRRESTIMNLNGLVELEFLWIVGLPGAASVEGLETLRNLRRLSIRECRNLGTLDGLGCLTEIQELVLYKLRTLKRLPDLGGLTCLEKLELINNKSLEKVGCLSPALKEVIVENCQALKKMPDLGGLTRLQKLTLSNNCLLEEVGGLNPALKQVIVEDCNDLKMPDLGGLTCLQKLKVVNNRSWEVGCLGPALEEIIMEYCPALKKIPDLGGLTRLQKLRLCDNLQLEEVGRASPALEQVIVKSCGKLKKMPDLGGLPRLQKLELWLNARLEEVGCLSPALEEVVVEECQSLKRMPDLGGLTRLQKLTLWGNESLEEVGCLSPALEQVDVQRCWILKKLPGLGGLTRLQTLILRSNDSLEEDVRCLGPIKVCNITNCPLVQYNQGPIKDKRVSGQAFSREQCLEEEEKKEENMYPTCSDT